MSIAAEQSETAVIPDTAVFSIPMNVQFIEDFEEDGMEPSVTLLHADHSLVFKLDEVGFDLWQRVKQGETLGEMVDGIAEVYDAPREQIAGDIQKLARTLVDKGLLVVEGEGE